MTRQRFARPRPGLNAPASPVHSLYREPATRTSAPVAKIIG